MKPLALGDVVFSLKTFAAAMLAYWIALEAALANPYWAVGTVYIVAHPLSGAIASKAVYRLAGTVLGAVATVVLVPNLPTPELLVLGIALWCGTCLFFSMLDRTPRSYVFMLAGYTAALTGFSLVDAPQTVFEVAVSRVEEIGLGILCAALVSRAVFPRPAGPVLAARAGGWLDGAAALARDVLDGRGTGEAALRQRHDLAANAVDLRNFTTHVGYEGGPGRALSERMEALQQRMVALLPLLSEITDILSERGRRAAPGGPVTDGLAKDGAVADEAGALLVRIRAWIDMPAVTSEAAAAAMSETADGLLDDIARLRLPSGGGRRPGWDALLADRLARRLRDFVELWRDCRLLRADMARGSAHRLSPALTAGDRRPARLHTDPGMALLSAVSAVTAILLACTLWIATGWQQGWMAAQMASILCCVMATIDDARPALGKVITYVVAAVGIVFVYQFAVLPALDGFLPLVCALGLFLIPVGVMLATPARWLLGFQLGVNLIYMLGLGNHASVDFISWANVSLATLTGLVIAMLVLGTIRAVGAETSATRLMRAGWGMVIATARTRTRVAPDAVMHRMTDQLGLLVPRLAAIPAGSAVLGSDILRDLRVALSVLKIRRNMAGLEAGPRARLEALLGRVSAFYHARQRGGALHPAGAALLGPLDTSLNDLLDAPDAAARRVRDGLVGLRGALCPDGEPPVLDQPAEVAA